MSAVIPFPRAVNPFSIILATDEKGGIGKDGKIPWDCPKDMKNFASVTAGSVVIMGRKTMESLKVPLKGRWNIVVSQSLHQEAWAQSGLIVENMTDRGNRSVFWYADSVGNALSHKLSVDTFIIGGVSMYTEALRNYGYALRSICHTLITGDYECDAVMDMELLEKSKKKMKGWMTTSSHVDGDLCKITVTRPSAPPVPEELVSHEMQYLNLLRKVLTEGQETANRTGVKTTSLFNATLTFDLSKGFPLMTTKRLPFKWIVRELLWFLSGSTDVNVLSSQGVTIWDLNATQDFIDKRGLPYQQGDVGPMYSHQWRHAGAPYVDCKTDYTGQGVDQVAQVVQQLRDAKATGVAARDMIICAWSASEIGKMVISPCHVLVHFYIRGGKLDATMYQRSADLFLGVPFNVAAYSLLLMMMAQVTGYIPGTLYITFGDHHIYETHYEAVIKQLSRVPMTPCAVRLNPECKEIDDFRVEDFELVDYVSHPAISAPMAV